MFVRLLSLLGLVFSVEFFSANLAYAQVGEITGVPDITCPYPLVPRSNVLYGVIFLWGEKEEWYCGELGDPQLTSPPPSSTNTPPITADKPLPDFSEESGTWSDEGLSISWGSPDDLISSGDDLSDGKAYQVPRYTTIVPQGQELLIMDRPGGEVLGVYGPGEANLRIQYYHISEQDGSVWAGVCQNRKNCGWAVADYLVALPKGAQVLGMYSINAAVAMVYPTHSFYADTIGELYDGDIVAVIDEYSIADERWARICRLKTCDAWVPFTDLYYEF